MKFLKVSLFLFIALFSLNFFSTGNFLGVAKAEAVAMPDLQVFTYAFSNGVPAVKGVAKKFYFTALNLGNAPSNYLGNNSIKTIIQTVPSLSGVPNTISIKDYSANDISSVLYSKSTANGSQNPKYNSIPFSGEVTFSTVGTYFIRACVDKSGATDVNGQIIESDEANNCSGWQAERVTLEPFVDLRINNFNLEIGSNSDIKNGTYVVFDVANYGSAGSDYFGVKDFPHLLQIAKGFTNQDHNLPINLLDFKINNLWKEYTPIVPAATERQSLSAMLQNNFLTPGGYYMRVCADKESAEDATGRIVEKDGSVSLEDNNCTDWSSVNMPKKINLTPEDVLINYDISGNFTGFSSKITNSGNAFTDSSFYNIFQVAKGEDNSAPLFFNTDSKTFKVIANIESTPNPMPSLGFLQYFLGNTGNASNIAISAPYTFPDDGIYIVRACADLNVDGVGSINETDEKDNCSKWKQVNGNGPAVSVPDFPNLGIEYTSLGYISPTSAIPNTPTTFSATVINTGTKPTNYEGVNTFTNLFQVATNFDINGNAINPTNYSISGMGNLNNGSSATFSKDITFPLTEDRYYMRACADNNASMIGTISEGTNEGNNCSSWVEVKVTDKILTVATGKPTNITSTTASASVTTGGGIEAVDAGIVWSTTSNPTVETNIGINKGGWKQGTVSLEMTGLIPNTTYYVRAYGRTQESKNNNIDYTYGNQVSFKTSAIGEILTVTTGKPTNITSTTASASVKTEGVDAKGGDVGIVWSKTPNPKVPTDPSDLKINKGGLGLGTISLNMTGLTPDTTYYVIAYGRTKESKDNNIDYTYGNQESFKTSAITYTGTWIYSLECLSCGVTKAYPQTQLCSIPGTCIGTAQTRICPSATSVCSPQPPTPDPTKKPNPKIKES